MLLDDLITKKDGLEKLIKKLERKKEPIEGRIEAQTRNGHMSYAYIGPGKGKRRYLRQDELALAKKIIQQDYEKKLVRAAKIQLRLVKNLIKALQKFDLEGIYTGLCSARRALITPLVMPFDEYAKKWLDQKYDKLDYFDERTNIRNSRGERMHSKSECIISDILIELGIPYKSDYPVFVNGLGKVYVDFVVLKKTTREEIFIEHFGLMSDPAYISKTMKKMSMYPGAGLILGSNFLFTFEVEKDVIDAKAIKDMLIKNCL